MQVKSVSFSGLMTAPTVMHNAGYLVSIDSQSTFQLKEIALWKFSVSADSRSKRALCVFSVSVESALTRSVRVSADSQPTRALSLFNVGGDALQGFLFKPLLCSYSLWVSV